MKGGIYLLDTGGGLTPLEEQPYESGALLQDLLAAHPELLSTGAGILRVRVRGPRVLVQRRSAPDALTGADRRFHAGQVR